MILAIGLVTSTSLLALSHILIVFPGLYFLNKADYKKYSLSSWALLAFSLVVIISVLFNQDIAIKGYKPVFKAKYFLIGFLSIAPLSWFFKNRCSGKQIKWLLYAFCVATTFASLVGAISMYTEFNPVTWRVVSNKRNAGLFGMIMNYAHNLVYFQIILTGLIVYRKKVEKYISANALYFFFIANILGLYLTYTRGAWLAYLAGVPFFLLKNKKKWFLGLSLALLLLGGVAYKIAGKKVLRPQSDNERLSQWSAAYMAFKERPVLGYGYLNFEEHSVEIKKRYNIGQLHFGGHAHSNLMEALGSTGALGFLAFLAFCLLWFAEMLKSQSLIAHIGLPFIVVFFVGGLTQATIALGVNLFFIMGVFAIVQASELRGSE